MTRLALDIETIPIGASFSPAAGAHGDGSEGSVLINGLTNTDEEIKRLSLDALTARIVALAVVAFNENSQLGTATVIYGDDEGKILRDFWETLSKNDVRQFITHNGLNFDLPFIWRRSVINNIKPTRKLDLARYRTDHVYDTMQAWASWNYRDYVGLDRLALGLGIGAKMGNGGDVLKLWLERKRAEVASYCLNDVLLTYACFCKMNFLLLPDFEAVRHACTFEQVDSRSPSGREEPSALML